MYVYVKLRLFFGKCFELLYILKSVCWYIYLLLIVKYSCKKNEFEFYLCRVFWLNFLFFDFIFIEKKF